MKALVKTAKGEGFVELREVPVPEIGDGEVLIEVKAAGICGTDLHIYHDEFPYWPPVILGHEFAGDHRREGPGRQGLVGRRPRRRRAAHPGLRRMLALPHRQPPDLPRQALARLGHRRLPSPSSCAIPSRSCCTASPTGMAFEEAAVVEPTANVVHDVLERGRVEPADAVVVIGPGPIGLWRPWPPRPAGAARVDPSSAPNGDEALRLPAARKIAAIDAVWNVEQAKMSRLTAVMEFTDGRGADLVVEASGSEGGIGLWPSGWSAR